MVKVRDKIKLYRDAKSLEVIALFDTGSARSYVAKGVADKLGYEPYPQPIKVPLAVENYEAEVIGYLPAIIEVAGYKLPEVEALGVIDKLRVEAIIGVNIMGPYEIALEKDRIILKRVPPRSYLF